MEGFVYDHQILDLNPIADRQPLECLENGFNGNPSLTLDNRVKLFCTSWNLWVYLSTDQCKVHYCCGMPSRWLDGLSLGRGLSSEFY